MPTNVTSYRQGLSIQNKLELHVYSDDATIVIGEAVSVIGYAIKPIIVKTDIANHSNFLGICSKVNDDGSYFVTTMGLVDANVITAHVDGDDIYVLTDGRLVTGDSLTMATPVTKFCIGQMTTTDAGLELCIKNMINTIVTADYENLDIATYDAIDAMKQAVLDAIQIDYVNIATKMYQTDFDAVTATMVTSVESVIDSANALPAINASYCKRNN